MDRWTSGSDYERWMGRWSRLLAHEFLKWLRLPAGLRWLDVCCGSGIVTEAIVQRNAPASVVGVDSSPHQIDFARCHRSRQNVSFEVANAMELPFGDGSFDVAVSGLGLNFVPDPVRGLEEFRRVVRPGGAIAIYVWDYSGGARFICEFWNAAKAIDAEAASFDQATRFPMCTEKGLLGVFESARLPGATFHALEIVTRFASFNDYWEPLLSGQGSAPAYLATRDEKARAAIRERLQTTLPANAMGEIEVPARAWAVRARRP